LLQDDNNPMKMPLKFFISLWKYIKNTLPRLPQMEAFCRLFAEKCQ